MKKLVIVALAAILFLGTCAYAYNGVFYSIKGEPYYLTKQQYQWPVDCNEALCEIGPEVISSDTGIKEVGGLGITISDIDNDGTMEVLRVIINEDPGENMLIYHYGDSCDNNYNCVFNNVESELRFGTRTQGAGAAAGDIDGDGDNELFVMVVDDSSGADNIRYWTGICHDESKVCDFGPIRELYEDKLPLIGHDNFGGGAAIGNLDDDRANEIILMVVDKLEGNKVRSWIGDNCHEASGYPNVYECDWSPFANLAFGTSWSYARGGSVAISDINDDGSNEVIFSIVHGPRPTFVDGCDTDYESCYNQEDYLYYRTGTGCTKNGCTWSAVRERYLRSYMTDIQDGRYYSTGAALDLEPVLVAGPVGPSCNGNSICDAGETHESCPGDCRVCMDGSAQIPVGSCSASLENRGKVCAQVGSETFFIPNCNGQSGYESCGCGLDYACSDDYTDEIFYDTFNGDSYTYQGGASGIGFVVSDRQFDDEIPNPERTYKLRKNDGEGVLFLRFPVQLMAGESYKIEVWAKTNEESFAILRGPATSVIHTGSDMWEKLFYFYTAPSDETHNIDLLVQGGSPLGGSFAYFDDIKVIREDFGCIQECSLNKASDLITLEPFCGSDGCGAGDSIQVRVHYSGVCPVPSYVQIDASETAPAGYCDIQHDDPGRLDASWLRGINISCSYSGCTGYWPIAAEPLECLARTIEPYQARLWKNCIGAHPGCTVASDLLTNPSKLLGSFYFVERTTPVCGDSIIQNDTRYAADMEQCDFVSGIPIYGDITGCPSLPNPTNPGYYYLEGTLGCFSPGHPDECRYDTSACSGVSAVCGDNITEPEKGEECDDGNRIDHDGCSSLCRIEECGNSLVDQSWEICDGTDVGTAACEDIEGFGPGELRCNDDCLTYDTSFCAPTCIADSVCRSYETGGVPPCEDCPVFFRSISAAETETGVRFSGDIDMFPLSMNTRVCKGDSSISQCTSATCGLGNHCLCFSEGDSCELACAETSGTYYLYSQGIAIRPDLFNPYAIVQSPTSSYACPYVGLDRLLGNMTYFEYIHFRASSATDYWRYVVGRDDVADLLDTAIVLIEDGYWRMFFTSISTDPPLSRALVDNAISFAFDRLSQVGFICSQVASLTPDGTGCEFL